MLDFLFYKKLNSISEDDESMFLSEIQNSKPLWMTANQKDDKNIDFIKDKPNAGFFICRLKRFPKITERLLELFPEANIDNSYITKLLPGYRMLPHKDKNRFVAVIVPLGTNKGEINYYVYDKIVCHHRYFGPILSRVDVDHSASNDSDTDRLSITLEIKGSYIENWLRF